ncbi:MAG: hypothetical protein ACLUDU_10650 [Butyricimonas faecihominis]
MKSIIRYITSFFKGLFSLLTGMKVTLREFFTKKTRAIPGEPGHVENV